MNLNANSTDTLIDDDTDLKIEYPKHYKVILLNDDFTPMEFVVYILQGIFYKSFEEAYQIMMKVHEEGSGVCGVYPMDIAQTKVDQVMKEAIAHEYPLKCIWEEV